MVSFLDPQCIHVVAITKTQHLVMCLERRTPIATRDVQDVHLPLPDRDRPSSPHGNEYPLKQTRRAMIDSTKHDRSPSKIKISRPRLIKHGTCHAPLGKPNQRHRSRQARERQPLSGRRWLQRRLVELTKTQESRG